MLIILRRIQNIFINSYYLVLFNINPHHDIIHDFLSSWTVLLVNHFNDFQYNFFFFLSETDILLV